MFEHSSPRSCVSQEDNRIKVVAFGSYHSGKTSFIRSVSDHPLLTDVPNRDGTTTVALDLGIAERKGYRLYVYGTPGQDRFDVARDVVSYGLHAGLVVVDSVRGMTDFEKHVLCELHTSSIPCIVLANKQDAPGASLERVIMDAGGMAPVMPVSSTTGKGVDAVLDGILDIVCKVR
jgi:uncharacterized protein